MTVSHVWPSSSSHISENITAIFQTGVIWIHWPHIGNLNGYSFAWKKFKLSRGLLTVRCEARWKYVIMNTVIYMVCRALKPRPRRYSTLHLLIKSLLTYWRCCTPKLQLFGTVHPWVPSNTTAKCEVNQVNSPQDMWRTDKQNTQRWLAL